MSWGGSSDSNDADHALCMKAINLSVSRHHHRCYVCTVLPCVHLCDLSNRVSTAIAWCIIALCSSFSMQPQFTLLLLTKHPHLSWFLFQNSGQSFYFMAEKSYFHAMSFLLYWERGFSAEHERETDPDLILVSITCQLHFNMSDLSPSFLTSNITQQFGLWQS